MPGTAVLSWAGMYYAKGEYMLTAFHITQQGQNHIRAGTPCQDYSTVVFLNDPHLKHDLVIAAVSDGLGSCKFSQDGSRESSEAAVRTIQEGLRSEKAVLNDEYILALLQKAFESACNTVLTYADKHEISPAQLDCTLTVAVYDGTTVWFGHIGDDGIVALYTDGRYEMITTRHSGEFASSVYPLRVSEKWQFGKTEKPVASLAVMTDGVLDYVVGSEVFECRVFFPFLKPALAETRSNTAEMDKLKTEYEEYLKDSDESPTGFRKKVTDDITFAVVQNSETVSTLPPIPFDLAEWDRATEEYIKTAEEKLYKDMNEMILEGTRESSSDHKSTAVQQPHKKTKTADESHVGVKSAAQIDPHIKEAAQQLVRDFLTAGCAAGRGLQTLIRHTMDLNSAINSSIREKSRRSDS